MFFAQVSRGLPPFKAKSSAVGGASETASEKRVRGSKRHTKEEVCENWHVALLSGEKKKDAAGGTCLQAGVTVRRVSDFGFVNLNDSCCQ